jgi:hypothetical protein
MRRFISSEIFYNTRVESLIKTIQQKIREFFKYDKDPQMRKLMISEIDKITEDNGKDSGKEIYRLKDFLFMIYDDIVDVVEIGEVLLSLNRKTEFKHLFNDFIRDMTAYVSTSRIKDTYYQVKMLSHGITYEKKICEMLKSVDIESFHKFELWMKQIEDVVKSHK